ncbi:MAG: hypothetical protein H6717_34015 [Polyangiaceae bacterium]|nr:hypothetical protein [Polyangiaceae bacterium]
MTAAVDKTAFVSCNFMLGGVVPVARSPKVQRDRDDGRRKERQKSQSGEVHCFGDRLAENARLLRWINRFATHGTPTLQEAKAGATGEREHEKRDACEQQATEAFARANCPAGGDCESHEPSVDQDYQDNPKDRMHRSA